MDDEPIWNVIIRYTISDEEEEVTGEYSGKTSMEAFSEALQELELEDDEAVVKRVEGWQVDDDKDETYANMEMGLPFSMVEKFRDTSLDSIFEDDDT